MYRIVLCLNCRGWRADRRVGMTTIAEAAQSLQNGGRKLDIYYAELIDALAKIVGNSAKSYICETAPMPAED